MHFFDDEANWDRPVEVLTEIHQRVSEIACRGLAIVVSHHVAMGEPVILEGDDILPVFARAMMAEHAGLVRAAFLHEPDAAHLRANIMTRDRGISARSHAIREKMIALASADGDRLASAARRADLPIVATRPLRTLASRTLAAAEATDRS